MSLWALIISSRPPPAPSESTPPPPSPTSPPPPYPPTSPSSDAASEHASPSPPPASPPSSPPTSSNAETHRYPLPPIQQPRPSPSALYPLSCICRRRDSRMYWWRDVCLGRCIIYGFRFGSGRCRRGFSRGRSGRSGLLGLAWGRRRRLDRRASY